MDDNYYDFLTKITFKAPHEVTQAIYEHWMNTPKDNILVNLSASVDSLHKANIEKSKKIWKGEARWYETSFQTKMSKKSSTVR